MIRGTAALVAVSFVFGAAMGRADDARAKLACPSCGHAGEGEKCSKDGSPLVRSELVVWHNLVLGLAELPMTKGYGDSPFAACLKDDDVDAGALVALVQDYKAARAKARFGRVAAAGLKAQAEEATLESREAAAIGALKVIATAQAVFREGGKAKDGELRYGDLKELGEAKVIDATLATGKKNGYAFEAHPSTDKEKCQFCWWATASPIEPGRTGRRYFFTNQMGVIYYSMKPIPIDDKVKVDCTVPDGLTPVGK